MSYRVRVAQEAKENIAGISSYIAKDSPANARRWRSAIRERIRSLQDFPERHEVAYTAEAVGREVRHTFLGVYRILYTILVTRWSCCP
jgi:plasmid stabilization system protein ParE